MRIHAGGFCFQGLTVIPILERFLLKQKEKMEIISNGLAGFYAILFEHFGKFEARRRLQKFIEKFEFTFQIIHRKKKGYDKNNSAGKKVQIAHCIKWSTSPAIYSWNQVEEFLVGLKGETCVKAEMVNLFERTVELFEGSSKEIAKACLAFPGVFPPLYEKYVNTTYLTQIPVSFLEDGDIVLVNFRDLSNVEFESIGEIILQSMECRMIELAKRLLTEKDVKLVKVETQISLKDIANLKNNSWEFLESVINLPSFNDI
ncbi:hypothetical protein JYK00_08620 [Thermosipho ferrireducens]|uniref:Uncharacterized protein n=1 Tax=Thermosipho ferrireducens TaxID=2571116 RepID=A0ABX7S5H3_9BACT|nr:hypothetical protein [Thermosipho ferrireducens]QTA37777.1 hypothetical protein JYK00_08620 [Thermosipho ferrireducens]